MMPEINKPVRIAVNVMRARLTIIGFNVAIVSFQIVQLNNLSGGIRVPGINHGVHIGADIALFMALALSFLAMIAFLVSSSFDEVGVCNHWSFVAGDLLMYLGLAHTASGFFAPLGMAIAAFVAKLPNYATEIFILHGAVLLVGGMAWFFAIYVGPLVSLLRSPFSRPINITLGIAYLSLLLGLCWISSQATLIEVAGSGEKAGAVVRTLIELVQPFRW